MGEISFSREKSRENQGVWGSDLFLPYVIFQTIQFLCLLCSCSGLELGSLCRVSFSTYLRDLMCNVVFFISVAIIICLKCSRSMLF